MRLHQILLHLQKIIPLETGESVRILSDTGHIPDGLITVNYTMQLQQDFLVIKLKLLRHLMTL